MHDDDFDSLLHRARSGDETAFATVYRDVQPRLLRYLMASAPDRADDCASETWMEVVKSIRTFSGNQQGFRAWVFTIARHNILDAARYDSRRPVAAVGEQDLVAHSESSPDSADVALEAEATRAAVALVRTLPPDQAEVILLRVLGGLDTADVARMVDKSPGAVRVLAHRGLRRLARTLAADSVNEGVTL